MDNCIFCKIAAGEIPCHKVYESSDFLAFLDIHPLNPGHVLVIPKKHFRWAYDVEGVGAYFEVVSKIANAQKKALGTDYVLTLIMGQEIPHSHIHLIPKYDNDGHGEGIDLANIKEPLPGEMDKIVEKIKSFL
jgi:histidine triad (HIT) family protein